jgi:hypothetical protein
MGPGLCYTRTYFLHWQRRLPLMFGCEYSSYRHLFILWGLVQMDLRAKSSLFILFLLFLLSETQALPSCGSDF